MRQADGSTKTMYVSAGTSVMHPAEATLADLAEGVTVIAAGSSDSSDTVTARGIQIVPKGSDLGFVRGAGQGAAQR